MSSGAKYAPYVFDFKSVLKAHKLRPVHYSLFKLKKIRSGLADAVTYLTLFLFFFPGSFSWIKNNRLELINYYYNQSCIIY